MAHAYRGIIIIPLYKIIIMAHAHRMRLKLAARQEATRQPTAWFLTD